MSHIISDKAYNEYAEFKTIGKTPDEIKSIITYVEDEAPLPLADLSVSDERKIPTVPELDDIDWQKEK